MRKIFTLLLLVTGYTVAGQQYNNEWIKHSQTYYKFKVAAAGLYRIPKLVLDAAGIGNTDVQNFELWRNGEKVWFYTPVSSGPLPANGYIEFYGIPNDGKPDKAMYRDPAYQHSDKLSLQTDTAVYFLSVNTDQSGARFTEVVNDVQNTTLQPEPYFMYTAGNYYKNKLNPGFAAVVGEYVYSSSYDKGEYHSSQDITPANPLTTSLANLYVYAAGPNSTLRFGASGNALNPRTIRVSVNGTDVKDTLMEFFNDLHTTAPVPTSLITSGTAAVKFTNTSPITSDRMVVSYFELTYPREFNFGNQRVFEFELPARAAGYYLQITNFNDGGVAPVLYDLTHGERYVGDKSVSGMVRFALPGSASSRKLVLLSTQAAAIRSITSMSVCNFIRFDQAANQGDYIIISNPLLYNGPNGTNPVLEYKNYRESAAGGGHKVLVAEIDQLVDQFAFGIKKHPLSVRNFIRYARDVFSPAPQNVLIIGRGVAYNEYYRNQNNPAADQLNLVPTFGNPGSDNLLAADNLANPVAAVNIGRLSVVSAQEVAYYLEKVIEYEAAQRNASNTLSDRKWMKNIVHVTGSTDPYLGNVLCHYMSEYKKVIQDTLFGGIVSTFCKTSTNPVEQLSSGHLEELFAEGISVLTYFGHSSSTTLEFNIDNPSGYDNQGKYPLFFVNGCNAGNFFTYNVNRLVANETLSEKFNLAKQRGTIAFVASTHFGIVNYLNIYLMKLYQSMAGDAFGKTLGELQRTALGKMIQTTGVFDYYSRLHAEQITLHGDPAIKLNVQPQPDYVVEESSIRIEPTFISVAEEHFRLRVRLTNLGKAINDSITVEIKRQYPDGSSETIYHERMPGVRFEDSVVLNVPVLSLRDKGQNRISVMVDADMEIDEISESNNYAYRDFVIYEDEARPAFPYNYSIEGTGPQKFYASTANPLSTTRKYVMEIDTTKMFNSSLKRSATTTSAGGVIEFDPDNITYIDSTVYYWRVSPVPTDGGEYLWNYASFLYANGPTTGFNKSDFYQFPEVKHDKIFMDSATRTWQFTTSPNEVYVRNGVFSTAASQSKDFLIAVNGADKSESVCGTSGIFVNVLDSSSLTLWYNNNSNEPGRYGSDVVCGPNRRWTFQYNFTKSDADTAKRRKLIEFLDLIPSGHFVIVRNIWHHNGQNMYGPEWQRDTQFFGTNNSIYHRLLQHGFTGVDSMYRNRSFIFIFQKDRPEKFTPQWVVSNDIYDRISLSVKVDLVDTVAHINSPLFGPAQAWKHVLWDGEPLENPENDSYEVNVIGVDTANQHTVLYTLDKYTRSLDISSVDPSVYPYIMLQMRNADSVTLTPYQLKYWRVYYDPRPEGALAPNLYFSLKDTLDVGEDLHGAIAFKNISNIPFDSIAVKVTVLDRNNVLHDIPVPKQKPLVSGDTVVVRFTINTTDFPGNNVLFVDVNPDNQQPEQYRFNNFLYRDFYAREDKVSPLLDVTFDGRRILNRDIVSARPHIQIKLKDEARYLLLNDTSLVKVQIKDPRGNIRTYNFDGDTLRFTPSTSGDDNTATIDFNPAFLNQEYPEGDEYELIVLGKDRSNNRSGDVEYRVSFRVIAKPMISNLLNYPNPFTTSTAFVFTITGSEIPQNIKIQILTVTGKIVREITKEELGPLHIGRNITEFKWDGTDQYGQRLANGVYLYRVVTTMNGKPMEKYRAEGDNTDQYFTNGYGKMYLMR